MSNNLTDEVQRVLRQFKNLFNYRSIYLFSDVQEEIISPILFLNAEVKEPFYHQNKIFWLNYYQDILTNENISQHLSISDFLKYYNIDILYPIRENGNCYGFLGVGRKTCKIKSIELKIGELIVSYLAAFWRNLELLKNTKELNERTQVSIGEVTSLLEISYAIESGEDIQTLLEAIINKCKFLMKAEAASLLLLDENKNELEFRIALGPKGKEIKPLRLPVGKGIAGWVAKEGEPLLISDAYSDSRFDPSFDKKTGYTTKSVICVPLKHKEKIVGVVQALNRLDGQAFTQEDLRTFNLFATLAALAIENSRILRTALEKKKFEKDITLATEIQRLIIPQHMPKVAGLEMSGIFIPSKGISGDFYSVFPINEFETVFCVADVSGKGVPGAILVATLHATLKAYLDFTTDLVLILNKLNHLIEELSSPDQYITLFIGNYNHNTSELTYINAGHYPPILISKKNKPQKLTKGGVGIGVVPMEYEAAKVKFEKDDLLLMYTDGVVEAHNEKHELFTEENLIKTVLTKRSQSCEVIQDEITLRVLDHCGDQPLSDDFTIFLVRRK